MSRRSRRRPSDSRAAAPPSPPSPAARAARVVLPPGALLTLILLGAALLHWSALRVSFFADDFMFLEQVRSRSFLGALLSPDPISNFFRPVGRQLYFWLIGHLSSESPAAFHAVNLVVFLGLLSLLFVVVRRLAGVAAATVACAFLALHYAADVPLRWVSGSQELLAVAGALGAIALHLSGRRVAAAAVMLLALLSKESVALAPLVAIAADRVRQPSWRRAFARGWPMAAALGVWGALWVITAHQRRATSASLGIETFGVVAVFAHLVHVIAGLEWRGALAAVGRAVPPILPLIPVVIALLVMPSDREAPGDTRRILLLAACWAAAGVLPLTAVAAVWSAYYYLFALCGVALALGVVASRLPRVGAALLIVALATGSQSGRASLEFATGRGAWAWQSHVNRFYVDRATDRIARYLNELKQALPTVPPRSTFFFGGIPAFLAWQTGDGPLVRWAYRDTSLRSYYQTGFTRERASRGPVYFFSVYDDTLRDSSRRTGSLRSIVLTLALDDKLAPARDLMAHLMAHEKPAADLMYFMAWLDLAQGDSLEASRLLARGGLGLGRGPSREGDLALERLAAGDTIQGMNLLLSGLLRNVLEPRLHSTLSDVLLRRNHADGQGCIEALAARALTPDDPMAWLRWGLIQADGVRVAHAIASLQRSLDLGGTGPAQDAQVREIIAELHRGLPGGDLAQEQLKLGTSAAPSPTRPRSP